MDSNYFWLDYSQKDIWKDHFLRLPQDKRDIYYEPDYVGLYQGDGAVANCYVYVKKNDIYIYPFIMRSVPKIAGYFDISTPYGYGGPISNSDDPVFLKEAYSCFNREALRRKVVAEVIKFHPLLSNQKQLEGIFKGDIIKMSYCLCRYRY